MIGELTKDQIENILQSQAHCRIACTDGLMPYLVPVSYAYDGKYIYCQSKEGKKLTILRKNPNVCVQVETMSGMNNWQSVIVYGTFEELENEDAIKAREFLFSNVLTLMTSAVIHSFQHDNINVIEDNNRIKDIMFRVKINEVTGRYEK